MEGIPNTFLLFFNSDQTCVWREDFNNRILQDSTFVGLLRKVLQ
jgi:hypothetical protein